MDSAHVMHTRVLLLPPEATRLTRSAFAALKKDPTQPTGASKTYRESQSRIYKLEAPLFVGVGEGTDNMDFLADLSALKVIDPEEVTRARSIDNGPVPKSESPLLQKLKQGDVPYAHCAWCKEALKTRSMLEEHYYAIHHVVLQPSCCAPPSGVATATRELWFLLHAPNFPSRGFEARRCQRHPWCHVFGVGGQNQGLACESAGICRARDGPAVLKDSYAPYAE